MPINYSSGEPLSGSIELPQENLKFRNEELRDLPDGGICFTDVDSLWAHPITRVPYTDVNHGVTLLENMNTQGEHMLEVVRFMRYKGLLVLDVSHIVEAMVRVARAVKDGCGEEVGTAFEFDVLPVQVANSVLYHSVEIDGDVIMEGEHLLSFGELWEREYGNTNALEVIHVPLGLPDTEIEP